MKSRDLTAVTKDDFGEVVDGARTRATDTYQRLRRDILE